MIIWTRLFWHVVGPMDVFCVRCNRTSGSIKCGEFLDLASIYWLKRETVLLVDNVKITYDSTPAQPTDHSCPNY